ncbi:NAD(P)/FAD-dependent oxidoreductase [Roseobacteraceae bacterium NS-SX3]
MAEFDVAVAGAGMVGVSTVLWAQMRGMRVLLLDPKPPGSGTSSGSACTIATYACMPVNDPSVFTDLPRLLFAKDSPLAFSLAHAAAHPRWMLSFLANCRSAPARRIAGLLAQLLAQADSGLDPLIEEAGAQDLIEARGQLSVWSTEKAADAATAGLEFRRAQGIPLREIAPEDARAMEPGLKLPIARAVHYPAARHVRDPLALIGRFHRRYTDLGGETAAAKVTGLRASGAEVEITAGPKRYTAKHAVIACGAFSRSVTGAGTRALPLGTERGYHLMFAGEAGRVTRPVGWGEGGFYAVPTAKGLRLAGTVEIAGLKAPPNPDRLAYLARQGEAMLGPLPEASSSWLGFRPTMPDALPVIGKSPASDRIFHAFGHQHLGLTLGGITGRIVTDLIGGCDPGLDVAPFSPARRFA